MKQTLAGKNVLVIAAKLFNYEVEIQRVIEAKGANVWLFDQRPGNTFLMKVLIRLNLRFLVKSRIDSYYRNIVAEIGDVKFDYIFLVSPEAMSHRHLLAFKRISPEAEVIVYMWDSLKNKPQSRELIAEANKSFSFDMFDSKEENIEFLPLFYIDEYGQLSDNQKGFVYDLGFIGTLHSDRYKIVKHLAEKAKRKGLSVFTFFYSPSKILFRLQRLFFGSFREIDFEDVSFHSMTKNQVVDVIGKSRCVIDIQHPSQSGLTMRTIEILGARRKLVTTNSTISEYDFYHPDNIYILNRESGFLDEKFLTSPYVFLPEHVYQKYSISSWVDRIFG